MTSVAKFSMSKYKAYMAAVIVTYHITTGVNYSDEFLVKSYRLVHNHTFPTAAKYSTCYDFHVAFKTIISWGPIDMMTMKQLRLAAMYMVKLDIIGRGICLRGMLWKQSEIKDKEGNSVKGQWSSRFAKAHCWVLKFKWPKSGGQAGGNVSHAIRIYEPDLEFLQQHGSLDHYERIHTFKLLSEYHSRRGRYRIEQMKVPDKNRFNHEGMFVSLPHTTRPTEALLTREGTAALSSIKADTCGGVIRKFHEECGIGQSAHSTRGNVESMLQDAAIPKLDANLFTHIARHDVATFKEYYYRPAPDSFLARLAKLEDSLINNCNLWTIIRL